MAEISFVGSLYVVEQLYQIADQKPFSPNVMLCNDLSDTRIGIFSDSQELVSWKFTFW